MAIYEPPSTAICDSLGVRVINDMDFKFGRPLDECFYDNWHMNSVAAREYTRHIINVLKNDSILFND